MALATSDPFDALFRCQRALEQQLASNWLESATSGIGAFPPINVFQQGNDFAAIVEVPGVSMDDLGLEVKGNAIRISGKKTIGYSSKVSMHRESALPAASIGRSTCQCNWILIA